MKPVDPFENRGQSDVRDTMNAAELYFEPKIPVPVLEVTQRECC